MAHIFHRVSYESRQFAEKDIILKSAKYYCIKDARNIRFKEAQSS